MPVPPVGQLPPLRDVVCPIVADDGPLGRAPDLQAVVDGLEEAANGVALWRDLDLDTGVGGFAVDDGVGLAGLGVDVLRHISGVGVAPFAQGATVHVDAVRIIAVRAVRGVRREALHDVALIVAGGAADGVGGRNELDDTARHLAWCASRRDEVLITGVYRPCASTGGVVVVGGCVYGRQFDCCRCGDGGGGGGGGQEDSQCAVSCVGPSNLAVLKQRRRGRWAELLCGLCMDG
jgi:hypothetical protein